MQPVRPLPKTVELGVPLDVVLVVDQSGSLAKNSSTGVVDGTPLIALKASITDFVNNLQANGQAMGINHRISICGFASSTYSGVTGLEKIWLFLCWRHKGYVLYQHRSVCGR
jgi:hypothetical protein